MSNYYAEKLNSQGLFQVYDTAFPRIRQYFAAEIDFVKKDLKPTDRVLEVAAGYGRIVKELAPYCREIIGFDISPDSVELSREYLKEHPNARLVEMDAHALHFDEPFDVVYCLQNGLSATRADDDVVDRIMAQVKPGGTAYFSTYSENFWDWRIKWFEEQAEKKLLGELDYEKTRDGVIVCKDGFRATTQTPADYEALGRRIGYPFEVTEVDGSSLFLVVHKP